MSENIPVLEKDERYCRRCGFIDKRKNFGTDGVGHGVCPLCKAYQAFVRDVVLPREKLFRKNYYGPYASQQTCPRCGLILINDNSIHTFQECDEILDGTSINNGGVRTK